MSAAWAACATPQTAACVATPRRISGHIRIWTKQTTRDVTSVSMDSVASSRSWSWSWSRSESRSRTAPWATRRHPRLRPVICADDSSRRCDHRKEESLARTRFRHLCRFRDQDMEGKVGDVRDRKSPPPPPAQDPDPDRDPAFPPPWSPPASSSLGPTPKARKWTTNVRAVKRGSEGRGRVEVEAEGTVAPKEEVTIGPRLGGGPHAPRAARDARIPPADRPARDAGERIPEYKSHARSDRVRT